jgi:hypothetical protein
MVLEFFENSKYNFRIFKFIKSFARCRWVIMCMKYEKNCDLIQKNKVENSYHILTWFEIMITFQEKM